MEVGERRILAKPMCIMNNTLHPYVQEESPVAPMIQGKTPLFIKYSTSERKKDITTQQAHGEF